ncbi:MAG: DUF4931 domain-containing protein [bacterium]|nr:DUF4931 domain-containing protein [bacterium]
MAKYVPDIKTQRWVIIAPLRTKRPRDKDHTESVCPFCPGNERLTPPEVYRMGTGSADDAGWHVRVVPNLYPITDIHEVIIHGPDHTSDIERLPIDHVVKILVTYRDRFRAHEHDGHVIIFNNHGFHAGASLTHPHSQLVVVPRQINLDSLSREPIANVVEDSDRYQAYCPDFSQWPYEVWIAPKSKGNLFGDTADTDLPELAEILQRILLKIERVHEGQGFMYNYYIYHGADWFVRIIPRFVHRAGFELGTGLNVNITDPARAAEELRELRKGF